jgi:predicted nucleic acid-binding protein
LSFLLDTSAVLAEYFAEPGSDRVDALLNDPAEIVGISVLTLHELAAAVLHRTGSEQASIEAVKIVRQSVPEVVVVSDSIVEIAIELRREASERMALADCIIAATAASRRAILMHRDPHFAALPRGKPIQEFLPNKA